MLCTVCKKNEAKIHFTEVVEGKMQKIDLCEACSQEKGVADTTSSHLAELLLNMSGMKEEVLAPAGKAQLICPRCGFTQADLKKTARLGCPDCYETFAESLAGLLKNMHRGTRHIGKVPGAPAKAKEKEDTSRLDELQRELEKAVTGENFERAALLRDEIKVAKTKLSALAAS